jgi:hypothetical protein
VIVLEGIIVARHAPGNDFSRLRVVTPHTDVQRVVVVEHAKLGALGTRLAVIRILLHKVAGDRCRLPSRIVQHAVDFRRQLHAQGGDGRARFARSLVGGQGGAREASQRGSKIKQISHSG